MPFATAGEEIPMIPSTAVAQATVRRETFAVERICSSALTRVCWGLKPNIAPEEDAGGGGLVVLVIDVVVEGRERMYSNNATPPPITPTPPSTATPASTVRRDIPCGDCAGWVGIATEPAEES